MAWWRVRADKPRVRVTILKARGAQRGRGRFSSENGDRKEGDGSVSCSYSQEEEETACAHGTECGWKEAKSIVYHGWARVEGAEANLISTETF